MSDYANPHLVYGVGALHPLEATERKQRLDGPHYCALGTGHQLYPSHSTQYGQIIWNCPAHVTGECMR
ncbi:MAG: hypothetical protein WB615_03770 [Candidatus Tumulicola sp.]